MWTHDFGTSPLAGVPIQLEPLDFGFSVVVGVKASFLVVSYISYVDLEYRISKILTQKNWYGKPTKKIKNYSLQPFDSLVLHIEHKGKVKQWLTLNSRLKIPNKKTIKFWIFVMNKLCLCFDGDLHSKK